METVAVVGFAEVSQHNVHGHFAGDFTGSLTAHAIAHHKDAVARVITEVIFVILAYAADIGFACDLHCQRHAMSVFQRIPTKVIVFNLFRGKANAATTGAVHKPPMAWAIDGKPVNAGRILMDSTSNNYCRAIRDL